MLFRKFATLGIGVVLVGLLLRGAQADDRSQVVISATPVRINIASATPISTDAALFTPTPSYTPTPNIAALLQAKSDAGPVNVRSQPDPNSDKLGTIRYGDKYPVVGRYFEWYEFQYDPSPNKLGWVYGQLVDIIGDPNTIKDLNANLQPTVDPGILGQTQTWEAITQIPGGILTVTAQSRVIAAPQNRTAAPETTGDAPTGSDASLVTALPTFTYPPDIVAQVPTEVGNAVVSPTPDNLTAVVSSGVAPIVPILILAGLGILGLAISSLRR